MATGDYTEILDENVDDNIEIYLSEQDKTTAKMVEQGVKHAINEAGLQDDIDSIDVSKMSKGAVTLLTFAGAGDSAEIPCAGFNSIWYAVVGTAVTTIVKCAPITGGTAYASQVAGVSMTNTWATMTGISNFVKISVDKACTVYVQPTNA